MLALIAKSDENLPDRRRHNRQQTTGSQDEVHRQLPFTALGVTTGGATMEGGVRHHIFEK